jgi:hypothetical protein
MAVNYEALAPNTADTSPPTKRDPAGPGTVWKRVEITEALVHVMEALISSGLNSLNHLLKPLGTHFLSVTAKSIL